MKFLATAAIAVLLASPVTAASVRITITNNSETNGLYLTPFLNVFHSGDYSAFTPGEVASAGLEELAELGSTGTAAAEAAGAGRVIDTLTEPLGVGPAVGAPPVFDPGNSASLVFDLNAQDNMYLTLLSMIIPSNDTFITDTFRVFDANGAVIEQSVSLGRSNVYDSGTEVNEQNGDGQAFNTADGNPPGLLGTDEGGVVHGSTNAELATLFGQPLPTGFFNQGSVSSSFDNLVTISISEVPLPAGSLLLLSALGMGGIAARRKATKA